MSLSVSEINKLLELPDEEFEKAPIALEIYQEVFRERFGIMSLKNYIRMGMSQNFPTKLVPKMTEQQEKGMKEGPARWLVFGPQMRLLGYDDVE